ncbi:hypothetical protein N4P33_14410 [Streptomyces sp. 15-116A]|uniref:hypothetical protein n=1 Tax=Streptomyces sp. 15-116A TaxID=2259035 RepID=UPI0021B18E1D|nr:hypothetical protein [Streptomyces sp. 15-116A]MCT7353360.1 hypothetical protein [Streptomyces sp. 15-116A]
MSRTRRLITALAVCVVALAGTAGCASRDAQERDAASPSPVGELLDDRDPDGRPYREVDEEDAPEVRVEVTPDTDGGWDVRLTLRDFRLSPQGAPKRAEAGRGIAHLYVDDRLVARLRTPEYHLSARMLPRGTHHVTARLYADDGSVWAVDGEPVESTADVTVSKPTLTSTDAAQPAANGANASNAANPADENGNPLRSGGRGSPGPGERAS